MTHEILLMPRARRQLGVAVSWWQAHRPAASDLLAEEFARAVANLIEFPNLGRELSDPTIRTLLLPRTATTVLYRVRPRLQQVHILRVLPARR